jgi:signal transduction histidine kinase
VAHDDKRKDAFESWLLGEVLLFGLLGAALALFLTHRNLRHTYDLPELRLVLTTLMAIAAGAVAVLAGLRFSVEGRRLDLFLAGGFFVASASALSFGIGPVLGSHATQPPEQWAWVLGRIFAWVLIASAPFVRGRSRERALGDLIVFLAVGVGVLWIGLHAIGGSLADLTDKGDQAPAMLMGLLAAQALLNLAAVVGFGMRFRARGDDLDRWLALGSTLMLFASLHYVFTPLMDAGDVSQGDFLRVLGYGVLLVGVWRAIRSAEFGRAVAEERARVAREIHDGLAQYLFAIQTHVGLLETDPEPEARIARLKEASASAQQEARFAVLALSSAGGTAPFDAALRRYVEFLTADGQLEVDLEIDPTIRLAPDEQIEVFRIVQEGLGNVRKHANARRAEVTIGQRHGERVVTVEDDGEGFDGETRAAGQGLKNIRSRAKTIEGEFNVRSRPGLGTALEVVLRA